MSATVSLRCSLGDLAVFSGWIRMRQWGPWTGHVECASASALTEGEPIAVIVRREDGTEDRIVGAVRRSGVVPGSETLVVALVGGAGRLLEELPAVDHVSGSTQVSAGLVLARLAAAAGETLADGVADALDALTLPRWHRAAGVPAWQALDLLASELGYVWRVLPSGRLWLGAETWPASSGALVYMGQDPDDGATIYAPDGAPAAVGETVGGTRAVELLYSIAPGRLRLTVRGAVAGDQPRHVDRDLYVRSWPATALAQRDDGTLDVRCDDARIGELLAVPLRLGLPGCKVTVPDGTRVRVAFEGGSPAGAYATGIDADADATKALALVGDSCGYISVTAPVGGGPCVVSVSSTSVPGSTQITVVGPGHAYAKGVSA